MTNDVSTSSHHVALVAVIIVLTACTGSEKEKTNRIALSQGTPVAYTPYIDWLKAVDPATLTTDMYPLSIDKALKELDSCSGLLLTGGGDAYPGLYGKEWDTAKAGKPDHHRDSLELALINRALEKGMPILGICRGQQMLNIALGGTLIVDIPSEYDTTIQHRCEDITQCIHSMRVTNGSLLYQVSGVTEGSTNSSHHQAVDSLAPGLSAVGFTEDNLIEGIEWKNKDGKSFLLGVQWHPERMDLDNPLSGRIARRFLAEAGNYGPK